MDISGFLNRYWRTIVFFAVTAVVLVLSYIWRTVLLPFMLGLVLAYLFMPIIRWLERIMPGKGRHMGGKRVLAIFIIIVVMMIIVAFIAFISITYLLHSGSQMLANAEKYIGNFIARAQEWTTTLRNQFPEGLRTAVDTVVQNIANSLTGTLKASVGGGTGGNILSSSVGVVLGFAAVPLFLFYMLKDSEMAVSNVCGTFGAGTSKYVRNVLNVIERVLGRYIRAQFTLAAVLFALTLTGLLIIGVPLALPLAFIYALGELIPTFGVWIAGAIMAVVVLAEAPDKILWVIIMDLIVKLLENMLLVPRIQAGFMRIHPAVIIFLLVIGAHFWGFWGMVLTIPITATTIELFNYVKSLGGEENKPCSVQNN